MSQFHELLVPGHSDKINIFTMLKWIKFYSVLQKKTSFFQNNMNENLLKAKQKALVEQIEKEKIQSNKGSSYKLLVEQAKLKQATSKVSATSLLYRLYAAPDPQLTTEF